MIVLINLTLFECLLPSALEAKESPLQPPSTKRFLFLLNYAIGLLPLKYGSGTGFACPLFLTAQLCGRDLPEVAEDFERQATNRRPIPLFS